MCPHSFGVKCFFLSLSIYHTLFLLNNYRSFSPTDPSLYRMIMFSELKNLISFRSVGQRSCSLSPGMQKAFHPQPSNLIGRLPLMSKGRCYFEVKVSVGSKNVFFCSIFGVLFHLTPTACIPHRMIAKEGNLIVFEFLLSQNAKMVINLVVFHP